MSFWSTLLKGAKLYLKPGSELIKTNILTKKYVILNESSSPKTEILKYIFDELIFYRFLAINQNLILLCLCVSLFSV